MSFILKIVEGPMRGAEVALTEGLRVSVGLSDDCDVVIADGSLPPRAFELDVAADAVTLVRGEEPQVLEAFAPFSAGTSTFAVGPADAPWPEGLAERAREERAREEASGSSGAGETRGSSSSSEASDSSNSSSSSTASTTSPSSEAGSPPATGSCARRVRGGLSGCLFSAAIFFLILLLLAAALYFFWPKIAASCPAVEKGRVVLVEKSRAAWHWAADVCRSLTAKVKKPLPPVVAPGPTLAEIAAQYGLILSEKDGAPLLAGNLRRRTERLAIRSLALADDPSVRFDLTDDETLRAAADELLFVVTEGALKATSASNRVVAVEGRVATVAALEKAVRAISADVKGVERLDTAKVTVGGPVPAAHGETAAPAARKRTAKASSPDYPIAGILTAPYPCVVLRNGLRLTEGASIGSALLVKIEADKLTLKDGGATIEWKP